MRNAPPIVVKLCRRAMMAFHKLMMIVLVLFLELAILPAGMELIFGRSHGPFADTRFHRSERLAAYTAFVQNPSPVTKTAYQEELRLMREHPNWENMLAWPLFAAFVLVNGMWIHRFIRHEYKPIEF